MSSVTSVSGGESRASGPATGRTTRCCRSAIGRKPAASARARRRCSPATRAGRSGTRRAGRSRAAAGGRRGVAQVVLDVDARPADRRIAGCTRGRITAAAPTSSASKGAAGTASSTMKSSMIARWINGVIVVIAVAPSATPNTMNALRLCTTRKGQSLRSQPPSVAPAPAATTASTARAAAADAREAACELSERGAYEVGVVDGREDLVESGAHRALGREHRVATIGGDGESTARRSVSTAVRSSSPRSTNVSMVADTVGRASASRSANVLARSSPRTISASRRYCGSVTSVHARSRTRASHARVRTSRSRPGTVPGVPSKRPSGALTTVRSLANSS